MRRASRQAWCEAPRPRFYSCPGGGAQHRQPVARRPCGHERMRNAHKDTPKKLKISPQSPGYYPTQEKIN
ncbi:MAG: hypothetical protein NZ455_05060 [Bacteroidia bacterium]|nr:hypothetical protein [Bacteroidia bacterium]MDW8346443.1 hypothetical protein [Bacteroidia bacterium]